jgi:hypothetical protein
MDKITRYEFLKKEVERANAKRDGIRILLKKIDENFLASNFKSEVWLEKNFDEKKGADCQLQYFLGYVPAVDSGISVKTVIRDSVTQELIESQNECLVSIENCTVLTAACGKIFDLLKEIERVAREQKEKILGIDLESLEALASKDFGQEN